MPLSRIEKLLKNRIGLHSATIGSSTVAQAVEQRMRASAIDDIDSYYRTLLNSETEAASLIDAVVIPETWFYRDRPTFTAFRQWLHEEWLTSSRESPLRILSVPCSTGEEPYTLAMCMADCGIPAGSARIDAVDVSRRSLSRAREATYNSNSFRGDDLLYRNRHFHVDGELFRLNDDIRSRVSFEDANILDEHFIQNRAAYDVIFCRNLLIYFDRTTQHAAIDGLQRLMRKDSLLFLGHSETSLLNQRPFRPLNYPRCFGFRFTDTDKCRTETAAPRPARRLTRDKPSAPPHPAAPRPFSGVSTPAPASADTSAGNTMEDLSSDRLEHAAALANQGHMDEAALYCEALIADDADLPGAYYLLGVIRDAAGSHADAERLLRKTVYLDPNHYEALSHLATIYANSNQLGKAQQFRERAARVHARKNAAKVSR